MTVHDILTWSSWLKSGFRNPVKYGYCTILSEHFSKGYVKGKSPIQNNLKGWRNKKEREVQWISNRHN